ncbi:MAG: hypothetical protein STSR0002_00290 [Smithella sp.]|jgi:hypothetical protein
MLKIKRLTTFPIILSIIIFLLFSTATVWATGEVDYEAAIFSSTAPDVFILLDRTDAMSFGPDGDNPQYIYGATTACTPDTTYCAVGEGECVNGYCRNLKSSCTVLCTRAAIARRAIFSVLNYNNDNAVDNADSSSLNVRLGAASYGATGYNLLQPIGATYQKTLCGSKTTSNICNLTVVESATCQYSGYPCIVGAATDSNGAALISALNSVKSYYDGLTDSSKDCRQKFIILITAGGENTQCAAPANPPDYFCSGTKDLANRRQLVLMAKYLAESSASTAAGAPKYKLIVIGIPGMKDYAKNTLDWMAFWGDSGNATLNTAASTGFDIKPINLGTLGACSGADASISGSCQKKDGTSTTMTFYAPTNDPGYIPLPSSYKGAYLASTATDVVEALKESMAEIANATYSFTQSSIQAVRTTDESYVYEASFSYNNADPMYIGHLKRYAIDNANNGAVSTTAHWDAGEILQSNSARNIKTHTTGSTTPYFLTNFPTATFSTWDALFATSSTTAPNTTTIINFVRNGDTAYATTDAFYGWKLGDVFHSSPLSIATPNANFVDHLDSNTTKAFATYRTNHERTVSNGNRIILAGANDGQLHAFKALDGSEVWSFIPPNLLAKLQYIAHCNSSTCNKFHPTTQTHRYFVDGPLSSAEVWTGTPAVGPTAKSVSDWHTYMAVALGRGGVTNLWSHSTACDSDFNSDNRWTSYYNNYCGYYFLDISDTSNPVYVGRIGGNSGLSSTSTYDKPDHLGEPWSKMFLGRIKIEGKEKWVGLIGGGYSGSDCKHGSCDLRGKGFFVVDLSNGAILWSFTRPATTGNGMDYDLVAGPSAADSDGDGFLDTAYIGDVGKNIWRFKFCSATDTVSCGVSSWSGSLLLNNN